MIHYQHNESCQCKKITLFALLMFGAQIPRRHSSFHNKHVNPHMLCLIMAPCISPQATGTISKLAQILFILSVLSASGWAGASQAAEPLQQFQRTGAVWQRSDTSNREQNHYTPLCHHGYHSAGMFWAQVPVQATADFFLLPLHHPLPW